MKKQNDTNSANPWQPQVIDSIDIFKPGVWENIFLNAPIGIFITDIHRKVLFSNTRAAGNHGYETAAELIGQVFPNFLSDPTDIIENLCSILELQTNKIKLTYEVESQDKNKKIIECTISVLKTSQLSPIGFLFFCDDITKRALYEQEINRLNITDSLTSLYNQRYLHTRLAEVVNSSKRKHFDLSIILLDIDKFKSYNDRYGHLEGDKVLIKLGAVIHDSIRNVDLGFRYGGEEFVIMLPYADLQQATYVADRVRFGFADHNFDTHTLDGDPVQVNKTISLGIALLQQTDTVSSLLARADAGMYQAKNAGGNRITRG